MDKAMSTTTLASRILTENKNYGLKYEQKDRAITDPVFRLTNISLTACFYILLSINKDFPGFLALVVYSEVVLVRVAELAACAEVLVLAVGTDAVVEVDSAEHPKSFAFPNIDHYATSASSVKVFGWESVHSPIGNHTNSGLCSILSNPGLHNNKNLEHSRSNPSHGRNNVSDTNTLPIDTTTNHSRKISLHLYRERHKHRLYQVLLSHSEVNQIQRVEEKN